MIVLQVTVNKVNVILFKKNEIWIQQTGETWAIKKFYPLSLAYKAKLSVSDLNNSFVLSIYL